MPNFCFQGVKVEIPPKITISTFSQGSASDAKDHFKAVKSIMCQYEFLESYINCFYVPNLQMDISFDENKLCLILIHGL